MASLAPTPPVTPTMADNPAGMNIFRTVVPSAIIGIYLFLRMIYLSEGGSIQVSDYFIAVFLPFLVNLSTLKAIYEVNRSSIVLLIVIVIVNAVWFFITSDPTIGINMAYYGYNFLLFAFVFSAREGNRAAFDRYIPLLIVISALVQIAAILFLSDNAYRSAGTFSNPNQLAYWAICLISCQMLLARDRAFIIWISIALLGACLFLSLSRGGLMGFTPVVAVFALQRFKNLHLRIFSFLTAAILLTLFVGSDAFLGFQEQFDLASKLEARSEQRSISDEFENRNYSRIINNPEYIPFGAGEGAFERFEGERYKDGNYVGIEIHSTYATLLFSYGVLGLTLFAGMLWTSLRTSGRDTAYVIGILLYGLSHNGLRFALFWFFLAILTSVGRQRLQEARAAKTAVAG